MITYRIEFSRPGQLPFAVAHQRTGGRYGPTELVPLGGSLEILAGNLCGSGELTLNRVPERDGYRLRVLDRVQVFFSDSPEPVYLGEVICDPRPEKEGGLVHLKLQGLWERVKLAAWSCDTDAQGAVQPLKLPFKQYILAVLSRAGADLPPGVTIGAIPEVNATLRAVTIHELLGDTFQALLPVTQGGSVGITARGELTVTLPDDTRRHRFIRTKSERPPGEVGEYRNAIRFPYKKPDGTDAYYVYRYGLDIAEHGASWLPDGLPSNVTAALVNPYAGEPGSVTVEMVHPDNPQFVVRQTRNAPIYDPAWTGKAADGLTLGTGVLYGVTLPILSIGHEEVEIPPGTMTGSNYLPLFLPPTPDAPSIVAYENGARVPVYYIVESGKGRFVIDKEQKQAYVFSPQKRTTFRYEDSEVVAYRDRAGHYPNGFGVQVDVGAASTTSRIFGVAASSAAPGTRDRVQGWWTEMEGGAGWQYVQRPFQAPAGARTGFGTVRQWRSGDTVTTDAAVGGVTATDRTVSPPVEVTLKRLDDDPDTGRRVWAVPRDTQLSGLTLTGDPAQIGWVGVNLSDEAGLTAYAVGKLLSLVNPILSWKGKYDVLRRLDVRGTVAFDDEQGDVELDIVRGVYDLTGGRCVVEAGTKQALDDSQALARAFEGIERVQRLQQRPGGQQ